MGQRLVVLESDGVGLVVEGTARSVRLCLEDARRQGEDSVWLTLGDGRLALLDADVSWEIKELHHAEG